MDEVKRRRTFMDIIRETFNRGKEAANDVEEASKKGADDFKNAEARLMGMGICEGKKSKLVNEGKEFRKKQRLGGTASGNKQTGKGPDKKEKEPIVRAERQ